MLVFFIIAITLILIYLSGIKIHIEELEIERIEKIKINNLKINLYFLLFNKIKLIKFTISKKLLEKINFEKILDRFKGKSIQQDRNIILKYFKELQLKIEKLKISATLGMENFMYLAFTVVILNIVLSIFLAKNSNPYKEVQNTYTIKPLQTQKFYFKISINCIISVKIANIINMIIKNRSDVKHERTSNRSFNGNCYE